ncbi:MAG: PGF-CTERM sorting domain-containing protein [Halobacterium sp.]
MRRCVVAVFVVALVATPVVGGALAAGAPAGGETAAAEQAAASVGTQTAVEAADGDADRRRSVAQDSSTIEKHIELSLTPSEPGRIDVEVTYDIPDPVTSLKVGVPSDATDVQSASFSRSDGQYAWDGTTDPASLSFTLPANKSASGARSPSVAQDGKYSFVDTGPWAMVTVPGLRTEWSWRNADSVSLTETVGVAGEGSTGGEIAFLGPVKTYRRQASDQNFTLAVPEAASLKASPGQILDALAAAAGRFHVGERNSEVWFAAAPTGADWGVRGVEYGGSDAWVLADSPLEEASNVWFHEYVHTRQSFTTATSGRWTTEASAEYYSALLALRTGYIGFQRFETFLSYGERDPWRNAVLADPDTWSGGANYVKGGLVWGAIDRQIRLATNSTYTMADVLYRLNQRDKAITNGDVLTAVADVSSTSVREYALKYTETSSVPEMWTRSQHAAAFGTDPPRMEFDVREYRVEGPFRNKSYAKPPTLYVGETLTVTAVVTNDGGQTGEYTASLSSEDRLLARASGGLAPTESDRVALSTGIADAGTYTLSVGRNPVSLTAREPADVKVRSLSVSSSDVDPGEDVTATVRLSNPTDDYAQGSVDLTVNGEHQATLDATLAPGQSTTRRVTVPFSSAGEYEFAAGDQSASVTVGEPGGSGSGDGQTGTGIPGFGVGAAVAALAAAALVAGRD